MANPSPGDQPVTIRHAVPDDLAAVGKLGALLVRTHHDLDQRRFIPATPQTERGYAEWLGSQLTEPNVVILVAERAGAVVAYSYAGLEGFDYMSLRGPAGFVHDIVVDPGYRAGGVGAALLEATVAELAARGAPRVLLWTAEGNASAQRLFARLGFRRTMIEMTRELPGDA